MTIKSSVFIAISLDGFIARTDGSIDWLNEANSIVPKGEDCGFVGFMESVDVLVMGRNTFEQVLSFGEWSYGDKKLVVLSQKGVAIPDKIKNTVSMSSEDPKTLVERLASEGAKHLYIDGGKTIQSFLAAGLINEITITTIPVLLGTGLPLFGPLKKDINLKHVSTNAYPFGFVQSMYCIEQNT
jgi:dihydrofolate reductase